MSKLDDDNGLMFGPDAGLALDDLMRPIPVKNVNKRTVYVPLDGPHFGAQRESILPDGRVVTVYRMGGFWQISLSMSPTTGTMLKSWKCPSYEMAKAIVDLWDGDGVPAGCEE